MGRKERCFIGLLFSARLQLTSLGSHKPLERPNVDSPRFGNAFESLDLCLENVDRRF